MEKDFVLSPLPEVERFQALINMKQWQCGIFQMCDSAGEPIADPLVYALFFNQLTTLYGWTATGEFNKDGIFHVHALLRTASRTDSLRRSIQTTWENLNISSCFTSIVGQQCSLDCLKLQRCHKPSSLAGYMMKGPEWIISTDTKMLQLCYDIDTWELNKRFKPKEEDEPETAPEMNVMTRELIDLIIQHSCKTIEDCMRHGSAIISKYLHKPGIGTVIENCIKFVKACGATWNLNMYEIYEPDPSNIHKCLLHQGISPKQFDNDFFQWITKMSAKKNTFCLIGPSNTGKSAFIQGLKSIVPWGEIVNGSSGFNFEGLIEQTIGIWEEPLINPELAEKCKQIFEGMVTSIPVKYKKPHMLPRIPILMTTNHVPWRWCTAEEEMFKNRMYMYEFKHPCLNEVVIFRTLEHSCQCRYCKRSSCCEAAPCAASLAGVPGPYESLSAWEHDFGPRETTDVGTGSMSGGDGGDEGSSGGARGGDSSSSGVDCADTREQSSSRSSGTEQHMGRFRIVRSDNPKRRSGTVSKSVESTGIRGSVRDDSSGNGAGPSRGRGVGGNGNVRGRVAEKRHSSATLGSWLSRAGTQRKDETETKKARVDRVLESKLGERIEMGMTIPTGEDWKQYLSYLYCWHGC